MVPSKPSNALASPWLPGMPVQAELPSAAAQLSLATARAGYLLVSDKAKFKGPHKPGTLCFRLIQHRSHSNMGSYPVQDQGGREDGGGRGQEKMGVTAPT